MLLLVAILSNGCIYLINCIFEQLLHSYIITIYKMDFQYNFIIYSFLIISNFNHIFSLDNATEITPTSNSSSQPWTNWRLDDRIKPIHYEIFWDIDLESDKFNGNVTIEVETAAFLQYFVVHSKYLKIIDSQVFSKSNESLRSSENTSFAYDLNEYWIVPLKKRITPGQYKLYFQFEGNLSIDLLGLYRIEYLSEGKVQNLAVTQLYSTYARRTFPCFDEPAFKATFQVNVIHDSKLIALSNMPIETTEVVDSKNLTKFGKTVKMSTYLLALVVGDLVCKTNKGSKTLFRACTTKDRIDKIDYALEVGPGILSFYEQLYQIDYPLPKLDLISIPEFTNGGMENWGLITFGEAELLYDANESTLKDKMSVCSFIAHEIAHQVSRIDLIILFMLLYFINF